MVSFKTAYVRIPDVGEDLDPTSMTEQAGYVPPDRQIEQMMLAGQRLQDQRDGAYYDDPDVSDDNLEINPLRHIGLDPAEATELQRIYDDRLQQQKNAADLAKKAAEDNAKAIKLAAKKSPNGDETTPDTPA